MSAAQYRTLTSFHPHTNLAGYWRESAWIRAFCFGICYVSNELRSGDEVGQDKIDANVEAAEGAIAVGKGIQQSTARAGDVHVNFPPAWTPAQSHGQGEGLSMAAEQRLDAAIQKLREDVTLLNGNVIGLTYQLKSETESRQLRTESQERIVNTFVDTIKAQVVSVIGRLNDLEIRAAKMESQRGKRDPVMVVFAGVITVAVLAIAWSLISRGGL